MLLIVTLGSYAQTMPSDDEKQIMAARQVMMRILGMKASSFTFEKIKSETGQDVYEVIALGGKVLVKGSSTIAMTRGAYDYLRTACNVQYTWSTHELPLTVPSPLPDYTIRRTSSPFKYRQYLNPCTFGYTTAYWQWDDWEKELDWMALHGINLSLALNGTGSVLQKVFKDMGLTNEELDSYFNGPAFLPWQYMGNVYGHDAPLPASYIKKNQELQDKILTRMRQLGIEPIVQGFGGLVPKAYSRVNPGVELRKMKGWCNFPEQNQAYLLPPGSAEFATIGKRYVEEYKEQYGPVHFYLTDPFSENKLPLTPGNFENELAQYGRSVSEGIAAGDPKGVWVMDGWAFASNPQEWSKDAVKSLLSQVLPDKMMILDMASDSYKGYQKYDGYNGKPWIYGYTPNIGGDNHLNGDLIRTAADMNSFIMGPKKGAVVGLGISPEGIDNNEVVYELLTDLAWASGEIKVKEWIQDYAKQRYGDYDEHANLAWLDLLGSSYSNAINQPHNLLQSRPPIDAAANQSGSLGLQQVASELLKASEKFGKNPIYRYDISLITSQYAAAMADQLLAKAMQYYNSGDPKMGSQAFHKAFDLIEGADALLSTQKDLRFENLVEQARKMGKDEAESGYYVSDLKRQATVWGTTENEYIHDFAGKLMSGLMRDYYLVRWQKYAEALADGTPFAIADFENQWIANSGFYTTAPTVANPMEYAQKLLEKAKAADAEFQDFVTVNCRYTGNNKIEVNLVPTSPGTKVYYTTDGSPASITSTLFTAPFEVGLPATVNLVGFVNAKPIGQALSYRAGLGKFRPVTLSSAPSQKYGQIGMGAINDNVLASSRFNDGKWLAFESGIVSISYDLEQPATIKQVALSSLEDAANKILPPRAVIIETSADGIKYDTQLTFDQDDSKIGTVAKKSLSEFNFKPVVARYVRITCVGYSQMPMNLPAGGEKALMFLDEVNIN